jgi:hypothetical protein
MSSDDIRLYNEAIKETNRNISLGKKVVPYIGSKDEYIKMYREHVEYIRDESKANRGFYPPDHPWLIQHVNTSPIKEVLQRDLPVRKTLVEPWIKQGDASMMYAVPGLGKSFLSLTIALAVAGTGKIKGLDWEVTEAKKVLYLDGEMPIADVKERLELIINGEWIEGLNKELALENLIILSSLDQQVGTFAIDLTSKDSHDVIRKFATRYDIGLIVVDNMSTLTSGMTDENASVQFTRVNEFISLVKLDGRSILVIHHANKEGLSYRGSSKQGVIFDSIIQLGLLENSYADDGATQFRLSFEKSRAKRGAGTASRVITMTSWGYSELADGDITLRKVLEVIKNDKPRGLTQRQIGEALSLHHNTVAKKVIQGFELGLLTKDEALGLYSVPPSDVSAAVDPPF